RTETDRDHLLTAESFPPRIRETLGAQKIRDSRFIFGILLRLFFGVGSEAGRFLGPLLEYLVEPLILLLLLFPAERRAILRDEMPHFVAGDVEDLEFPDLHDPRAFRSRLILLCGQVTRILLLHLVDGFLIPRNLSNQIGDIRQVCSRRSWKIEDGM